MEIDRRTLPSTAVLVQEGDSIYWQLGARNLTCEDGLIGARVGATVSPMAFR